MKLLVIIGQGYGNMIMATPTIAALAHMGHEVDLLINSRYLDAHLLFEGWDAVKSIYKEQKKIIGVYGCVIQTVWGRTFPPQAAKRVIGPMPSDLSKTHEVMANFTAAQQLGYVGPIPPAHCECNSAIPDSQSSICICPGYGGDREYWQRKAWPHWQELCNKLEEYGEKLIILGAPGDYKRWMAKYEMHLGDMNMREVATMLAGAKYAVAVDNGLAHISTAVSAPTFAIFGATSEVKNRPWGPRATIITKQDLECRPCQRTDRWDACTDTDGTSWRCMRDISAADVRAVLPTPAEMVAT